MKLVARYALAYNQAVALTPVGLWEELNAHEALGHVIKHEEDPLRQVLTYEVFALEAGEVGDRTWDSVLAAQLRASLVVEKAKRRGGQ